MRISKWTAIGISGMALMASCSNPAETQETKTIEKTVEVNEEVILIQMEAEGFSSSSDESIQAEGGTVKLDSGQWIGYNLKVPVAGRYKTGVIAKAEAEGASLWIEDYVGNSDGRTYNITGALDIAVGEELKESYVDGSPLNSDTVHPIRIHSTKNGTHIDRIEFSLLRKHKASEEILTQNMEGEEWELVWSDEFDGEEVDESKWTYDLGNWGWGNNELQYYTENRVENARLEDGSLIIEARKNDMDQEWTSARLTTRGKVAFRYGKIEFRAKVPREKGNWAAGWTLGNSYVDELSWPYCGEIDILESVGFEVDDETGNGIAHATVHTPAYYFKINNQISSTKEVADMVDTWHTYAVEWTPTEVRGLVDGEVYYLYDKNANDREWPFHEPQNIILNLAMGGGWGGALGMDPNVESQIFALDYVRVFQKTN